MITEKELVELTGKNVEVFIESQIANLALILFKRGWKPDKKEEIIEICETCVDLNFKKLILESAKIHEESWEDDVEEYKYDIREAIEIAAGKKSPGKTFEELFSCHQFAYPTYLLLTCCWNDALAWAENANNKVENKYDNT